MNNLLEFTSLDNQKLSPVEAMKILFSYPYINLINQFFHRTREYELGLYFVQRCRELINNYSLEITKEESEYIEFHITFIELSLYDYLNYWKKYLEYFEEIFHKKRTSKYITEFKPNTTDTDKFGRYLLGYNEKGYALVHHLYFCENRRRIIERKLKRYRSGKNVEYLKRHQKDKLNNIEINSRYKEMERLFNYMKGV